MTLYGLPILYALFIWWFSTGAILYLDGLPRQSFRYSMAAATLLMGGAVWGMVATSTDTTVGGAYAGFTYGLILWGWLELGFYMGFMIGPRRDACPPGCTGWQRFAFATQTMLYHELGALALTALIAAVTWNMPNKVALWTFLILWGMQVSAKLNVFLGVANLAESFLPEHLAFLQSYMTRRSMNLFFPVSVTGSIVLATLLVSKAMAMSSSGFEAVGFTILSTLTGLAILEHWFLVVPLPVEALWSWSLTSRAQAAQGADDLPEAASDAAPVEPFVRTLLEKVFPEAVLSHPATRSIARRQL